MSSMVNIKNLKAFARLMTKIWPPYLGAGIRVTKISPDYREVETRMKLRWYNKNAVGTHYGGSLYSMTDPFYMLMLLANIGKEHIVWDKSSTIEFVSPGKTEVRANFKLSKEMIEHIVEEARDGRPHYQNFDVTVLDSMDNVVAKVTKTLYIRRKEKK